MPDTNARRVIHTSRPKDDPSLSKVEVSVYNTGDVYTITTAVMDVVKSHGHEVRVRGTLRTLGGDLRGVGFEVDVEYDGDVMTWEHWFGLESDPWPTERRVVERGDTDA